MICLFFFKIGKENLQILGMYTQKRINKWWAKKFIDWSLVFSGPKKWESHILSEI